jgi:hypothetical protein
LAILDQANFAIRDVIAGSKFGEDARCIMTNFTPNGPARQAAEAAGCSMVHFSRINEWLEFTVLGGRLPLGRKR